MAAAGRLTGAATNSEPPDGLGTMRLLLERADGVDPETHFQSLACDLAHLAARLCLG